MVCQNVLIRHTTICVIGTCPVDTFILGARSSLLTFSAPHFVLSLQLVTAPCQKSISYGQGRGAMAAK